MSLKGDLEAQWRHGGTLVRLILINLGVFVLFLLAYLVLLLITGSGEHAVHLRELYLVQWLRTSSDPGFLLYRPWTIITYMFTHVSVGHIFWNMVLLWFSGRLFQDLLGGKRLLGNYLLGGIVGAVLFILTENFTRVDLFRPGMMGASAALMSILVGIATYRPTMVVNLLLIGPVKLMYVAIVVVLLDLAGIGSGDGVAHAAHIGGALYGFAAALQLKRGNDWSLKFVNMISGLGRIFQRKRTSRMRVEKKFVRSTVARDINYNTARKEKQARVDAILDKISRSGYDSLSKEEKDFLFKASGEG
jgi:membrane associated rhomboid family serine protease